MGEQTHCSYFFKLQEAYKQHHLMANAINPINQEINRQQAIQDQINRKLEWFSRNEKYIAWKIHETKCLQNRVNETYNDSTEKDAQTTLRTDRKCCPTKKGKIDIEYLKRVQEELMSAKKTTGMTSSGTQQLNDLIKIMVQRIQHGNKNHADEMKLYSAVKEVMETREIYTKPELKPEHYSDRWHLRNMLAANRDTKWKRSLTHIINNRLYEIEKLKRELMGRKAEVIQLKAELQRSRKKIISLQKELENVNSKRLKASKRIHMLQEQNKELQMSHYDEYESLMVYANDEMNLQKTVML
ncbi:hypothetical protein QVD17_42172 [Tagetes erecta]|uniref:Uncharacterized protein n=1 Tax=Tagetes erecta TaxID=13708 RepID=A0AAD8N986_TARER|nr:hypothetical protein QVD17_42172 [Tagetes erecta]